MIRNIRNEDIKTVAEIYNYYISNTIISFEEEPITQPEMRRRIQSVLATGFPWFVAEQGDQIIGYAYANHWNTRSAYRYTAEVTAYLSHLHTSKGIGTLLYKRLFRELKEMSMQTVIAGISLPNQQSVAFHEKFKMTKVAHFERVGYKFNQWIDVGYWQGTLNPQF